MKRSERKKKYSSLLVTSILVPSLIIPTAGVSAESTAKIHTSAKTNVLETNKEKISNALLKQFDKKDKVTFLVKMKEQVDAAKVAKEADKASDSKNLSAFQSKIAKRSTLVTELRSTALETQYNLVNYLEKQQAKKNVDEFQSFYVVNAVAVTATKEVMEQIAALPEVEKVLPNETRQLIQPTTTGTATKVEESKAETKGEKKAETTSIEWNIDQIDAPEAWEMGIDGSGTVVAVIDTGVQWDHPALKEKYRGYNPANPGSSSHEFNWFDATSAGRTTPYDDQGHGTHVTGTIVGSEPNGTNQIGVAPGAKFISVKAFTANGGTDVDLLEAGEWILAPKDAAGNPHPEKAPDIVNNSWGGGAGLDEWYRPMVQAWRAADIFPEFSAGNTTLTNPGGAGSIANPANYPESFATAATDINNNIGSFSLRGPSPYGEIKPDISAPGVNIRSAVPGSVYEGGWNGTSMAGPHISGVAALLRQVNASLSVDELENILESTAIPLTDRNYTSVPNNAYGHGLVNAYDAVSSIISGLGTIAGSVTKEGEDTAAPTIEHVPAAQSFKGMPLPLSAVVSDNISVVSVTLNYKNAEGEWVEVAAAKNSGDHLSASYSATIPGEALTSDTAEYKFTAVDFAGNTTETDVVSVQLLDGITVGYSEDFEGTPTGWVNFGTGQWEIGTPTTGPGAAFSGEKVLATNLAGNYASNENKSIKLPPIDLPEGSSYLQFKHWYNLERNYDYGNVFISTDNVNWTQLTRFNDLSTTWVDAEIDLSAYAGQRIYISFNLKTDGSVVRPGWFIDDVALTDTSIAPAKNEKEEKVSLVKEKALSAAKVPAKAANKPAVDADKIKPDTTEIKVKAKGDKVKVSSEIAPTLLPMQAQVSVLESGRSVYSNPANGSYSFVHSTGDFTVKAEAYGFHSETQTVSVAADGTSTANFTLEELAQGTVTGTITNEQTGQAVSGATLYLVEDAAVTPVVTNENGEFSLSAYEGEYTLKVSAPSYYGTEATITIEGGEAAVSDFVLTPFIGYEGEIGYDDGTAENARAFYAAGNGWAVKMSLEEGKENALVSGALLRFWDTSWPSPGGTEYSVSVYAADGTDGTPGTKLGGPYLGTALRDGNWTHMDLSEHGIQVDGDFYIVYTQTKDNPNAPGLGTDEDGENALRSYQLVSGVWTPAPEEEGNYMIRATVQYEVTAPTITSPVDGLYTNEEEVTVTGESAPNTTVKVYNNEEEVATVTTSAEGVFEAPITLANGANTLAAKVVAENGYTDLSAPVTVVLDTNAPVLTVTTPVDGSKTNRETVTVTGDIADENLDFVKVNGETATVKNGKYSKRILLDEGINEITVVAKDKAGNTIEETVSVDVDFTAPEVTNIKPDVNKTLQAGDTVKIEFDSEPGLDADFQILLPLTNIVGTSSNVVDLPMRETTPGHYVGYYTATRNVVAPGAIIQVTATDDYGNATIERASGKLFIN